MLYFPDYFLYLILLFAKIMNKIITLLALLFLVNGTILASNSTAKGKELSPRCFTTLYASPLRSDERSVFIPEETIYCHVYCDQFAVEELSLTIDWIDPTGMIKGQTVDSMTVKGPQKMYQKLFAVKLPKNGYVNRMMTGRRYSDTLFGNWTYIIYLNGIMIDKKQFLIQ
jgi:hypothetical protein